MNRKGADADENWGQVAEQLASEYLMAKGYTIRERNWRPKGSHLEVDIITQADNVIVFVEVKARTDEDYVRPMRSDARRSAALCGRQTLIFSVAIRV